MNYPQIRQRPAATGRQSANNNISSKHFSTNLDPASLLLARLEGVIKTSKGWRARCPAHDGKSASLAIAQGDNGTLLVHCFAGCQVHEVLSTVGLEVADLFVRRDLQSMSLAERSHLREAALLPKWKAAHEVLIHEAGVVLAAADQLAGNDPLDDQDLTRLKVAALRIFDAQEVLRGH